MLAARYGHTEVVRALLTAPGIDLNKKATVLSLNDNEGKTALGIAIEENKDDDEKTVENKTDIAALLTAAVGRLIFDAAKKKGNLLREQLDVWSGQSTVLNWANPDEGEQTPLIISCQEGMYENVKKMLAQGESPFLRLLWASVLPAFSSAP